MTLTIYGRATWGARYDDGDAPAPTPAREVWLHHSATTAPPIEAPFEDDAASVRQLEQIGQDRFGRGISYTFVVPPSGRVFAGHSVDRRGTHTGGRNSTSRAICLLGDYEKTRPTDPQVAAVAELLALGHAQSWWTRPQLAGGHRDLKATACPGRYAYALIPVMNSRAVGQAPTLQEDTMRWSDLLPDLYPGTLDPEGRPTRSIDAGTQLAFAAARSAQSLDVARQARDLAGEARDAVARGVEMLRTEVKAVQVGGIDYQALASALADELLGRLAAAGTREDQAAAG